METKKLYIGGIRKEKDPIWPDVEVTVLFTYWKRPRDGFIKVDKCSNYMFYDKKGHTYQCHTSVNPITVWIKATGEEWSRYE